MTSGHRPGGPGVTMRQLVACGTPLVKPTREGFERAYNRLLFPDGREMKPDPYWPEGQLLINSPGIRAAREAFEKIWSSAATPRRQDIVISPGEERRLLALFPKGGEMASKKGKPRTEPCMVVSMACPACGSTNSLQARYNGKVVCVKPLCPAPDLEKGIQAAQESAYHDGCRRERQLYARFARLSEAELLREAIRMAYDIAGMQVELNALRKIARVPGEENGLMKEQP